MWINYLESLCQGDLSLFPVYLFSNLFISVWIYGYLFHTSGYNSAPHYFVAQIVLALTLRSFKKSAHMSFCGTPLPPSLWVVGVLCFGVLKKTLPYDFWHYGMLQAHFMYFFPITRINHCSEEPWFLLLEADIRNQVWGTGCYCCYWVVSFFSWQCKEVNASALTLLYIQVYKYSCIHPYLYCVKLSLCWCLRLQCSAT